LIHHIAIKKEYAITGIPESISIEKTMKTPGVKTGDIKGIQS